MKVDIFDINKFIKVNNLQEVTNPVTFNQGFYPTNDGLLSYTIFGLPGSYDRRSIFGYIDLKKKFLHPVIYKILTAMNRKFVKLLDGSAYFIINDKGELVEDNENGNTGIEWLYKNFDKLNFKRTDSIKRDNKIGVLENLDKNEIFVDKWLVLPAFLRDCNLTNLDSGKPSLDKINNLYVSLISLCNSSDSDYDFMGYLTEFKIQSTLVNIYEWIVSRSDGSNGILEKKTGLIKKNLMGKPFCSCKTFLIAGNSI
jgi:DNA-directed RNA polymerase beta' subunit